MTEFSDITASSTSVNMTTHVSRLNQKETLLNIYKPHYSIVHSYVWDSSKNTTDRIHAKIVLLKAFSDLM